MNALKEIMEEAGSIKEAEYIAPPGMPMGKDMDYIGDLTEGMKKLYTLARRIEADVRKLAGEAQAEDSKAKAAAITGRMNMMQMRHQIVSMVLQVEIHREFGDEIAGLAINISSKWKLYAGPPQPGPQR